MTNYREWPEDKLDYLEIGTAAEYGTGVRWLLEVDGRNLALFRVGEKWFAVQDLCTHDNGPLGDGELAGERIVCPRHGARFDLATGKALTLPAVRDIDAFPVKVEGGKLLLGLPGRAE